MGYLDDLSDEEFRAEVARTRGEKHELEMKLSRLHGQVDAIVDRLAAHPEFQLCLRGQAWIDSGREIARRDHGEFVVHGHDGRIREKDSFGNDPHPPKG